MKKERSIKEPSIIIRPIGKLGGLDNLHATFIVVIALLFILLLVVSYSKPIVIITNSTQTNISASGAVHTIAQIKDIASRVLASYSTVNSSLSLLPFISNVSGMSASYIPTATSWYVQLSAKNFGSGPTFAVAFAINDIDTSKITPLIQTAVPSHISDNKVVAEGIVKLANKVTCINTTQTQVYWFIDPYATGAVSSLLNATSIERNFGSSVNLTMKVIFSSDTQRIASSYGLNNAEDLGRYIYCASQQRNFSSFVSNLNSIYASSYVSQGVLSSTANFSRLNFTQLDGCLGSSQQVLNTQSLLAKYYNITQTPMEVVNCQYLSIPQTVGKALCYSDSSLC
jgi:hypothetical protein